MSVCVCVCVCAHVGMHVCVCVFFFGTNNKYFLCLCDHASVIQQYKQPTRCSNNNLLIISISSTCFRR